MLFSFLTKNSRSVFIGVIALFAVMLAGFSLWRLPYSPATWFDEGISLNIARQLVENGIYSLPIGPNEVVVERQFLITNNYPLLLPVASALHFFGFTITAARLPMILFLWLFVGLSYALVKKEFGRLSALGSAALIISFLPFYGHGKAVLGEVPGLVYFLTGLLILSAAKNFWRLFLAGLFFGLAAATKPFFLIVGAALFIGEAVSYYRQPKILVQRLACLGLGAFGPFVGWLYTVVPEWSMAGLRSMAGYYLNSYAAVDFGSTIISNIIRFMSEWTPAHFAVLAAVGGLGLYYRWREEKKLSETLVIVGVFIIFNLLWYLKTPGWYRYFFTAHLLAFLFFPAALFQLARPAMATCVITALFLFQSGYALSQLHTPLYYTTEAHEAVRWATNHVSRDASLFIINHPSLFFLLAQPKRYQYLQINPGLHFGRPMFTNQDGEPYQYIFMNGGLDNTELLPLQSTLQTQYQLRETIGHVQIYSRL